MAVPAAVTTFTDAAAAFATAAKGSIAFGDASLATQLQALPGLCDAAISALRAASESPEVGDAVSACEVLLAQCSDLGDSVLAQLPPAETWIVPVPMPVGAILTKLYGAKANAMEPDFLAANPIVLGTPLIPAGTVLRIASV
jgi:hypothetical protein